MSPPVLLLVDGPLAAAPEDVPYDAGPAACWRPGGRAAAGSGGSPAAGRVPGAPRGGATAIRRITGGAKEPETAPLPGTPDGAAGCPATASVGPSGKPLPDSAVADGTTFVPLARGASAVPVPVPVPVPCVRRTTGAPIAEPAGNVVAE
jgi:hypothetical protein